MGFGAGLHAEFEDFSDSKNWIFRGVDKLCFNSCIRVDVKCMNIQKVWNRGNV